MANYRAISTGSWSNLAIWQDDSLGYFTSSVALPTTSDDVYSNNFSIGIDTSIVVGSLRNTAFTGPTFLGAMSIPLMTSNNLPSGVAAASTAAQPAWQAFDRNTGTVWQANALNAGWLSYQFTSGKTIKRYGFFSFLNNVANPRTWTFEGSNDGSSWAVLDTQTNFVTGVSTFYSFDISSNVTSYLYYRINITAIQTAGNTINLPSLEMSEVTNLYGGTTAGGSFIFNSGSISGSCTSTTTALAAGATNLIQVTATTGSVTLNLSSNVSNPLGTGAQVINHSGNCDFNLNGQNFAAGTSATNQTIAKSSTGTITITGNLTGGGGSLAPVAFSSNNGNTIVIGNVIGGNNGGGINQSAGNLTITGNIIGGIGNNITGVTLSGASSQFTIIGNVIGGTFTNTFGINHSGTSGSVVGNVTGGSGTTAHGINTVGNVTVTGTVAGGVGSTSRGINTSNTLSVTGNIIGGAGTGAEGVINTSGITTVIGNVTGGANGYGVGANSTNAINVTGTVTAASGTATGGVYQTGGGVVNLTGNMINVAGRQAIYSQNLFISNTSTSQWRLFTPGSQNKTLYSADTFPNLPSSSNVRSGSLFGPSNTLSGSMRVPSSSDVRINVPVDNTTGTATSLTAADFLNEISSSTNPVAVRFKNIATDSTVGSLLTGFNNGGF